MLTSKQKADWLAALRSGEYKQGKNYLYDSKKDSYCCLGVLAKINNLPLEAEVKSTILTERLHSSINLSAKPEIFSRSGYLDDITGNKIDRLEANDRRTVISLAAMNDLGSMSFSQIADWLEQNLPTSN